LLKLVEILLWQKALNFQTRENFLLVRGYNDRQLVYNGNNFGEMSSWELNQDVLSWLWWMATAIWGGE
jgi:hypothetical protein